MNLQNLADGAKAHLRSIARSRQVRPVRLSPGLKEARHVAILVVHNEAPRIPYVLEYYRKRGIGHFIFIDNMSTDGTGDLLRPEPDISLFVAEGSYRRARFGIDWVNALLQRYCVGKWILHVDADEFLVFPDDDTQTIPDLTDRLARAGQISLQCVMVDMYSAGAPRDNVYEPGQDPLSVCPLYDRSGYASFLEQRTRTLWIKGGVRGRLFFGGDVWAGPALNKTPLVLWRPHYAFLKSAHQLWPPSVNDGAIRPAGQLRGALLHFKFLADISAKLSEEARRRQHTEEYGAYGLIAGDGAGPQFVGPQTSSFEDWRSLERDGLIGEGGVKLPRIRELPGKIAYASLSGVSVA